MRGNKGFTLLELLVVIAIIGLLSSVAITALQSARAKARDAIRYADAAQIAKSLDLYYDKYEKYPEAMVTQGGPLLRRLAYTNDTNRWTTSCTGLYGNGSLGCMLKEFIELPYDPTDIGAQNYRYQVGPGGDWYLLYMVPERDDALRNCLNNGPWYYGLYGVCNPGPFGPSTLNLPNAIRYSGN